MFSRTFYQYDCMNVMLAGRLWSADAFKDEAEAISIADDYEAALLKIRVDEKGNVLSRTIIHDPLSCY